MTAVSQGGSWRFSAQGNGSGIDPEGREVIVGLFKRPHRD